MGEPTGEDWYVEFWLHQSAPRTGSAADRVRRPPTLAQHEAELVWHFARCDADHLELTSLENRLYYGPVSVVSGFTQPNPGGPVQFNMELYGEHHSALLSLHSGRLDVLNQLPEQEPLDLFVRQLNESLERTGRQLVELTEVSGVLRFVKSSLTPPARERRRLGVRAAVVATIAGGLAIATALFVWFSRDRGEEAAVPTVPGPLRTELVANHAVDCRLGTERRDSAIEVEDVTLEQNGTTGILTVQLSGAPFGRFSTTVGVVVPAEPVTAVEVQQALSYLFLPGQRWETEITGGITSSRSLGGGVDGAPIVTTGPPPVVAVGADIQGHQWARFVIPAFPAVAPGFDGSVVVVTSGIAADNGGAGPETCTANLVRVTRG